MQQSCTQCGSSFDVTDDDLAFYDEVSPTFNEKKYRVPPPTACPDCRQRRRLAWRNERVLYYRKCDKTDKKIISVFSPDKPFTVYDNDEWYGSDWDGKTYGRDVDFNRPFFEQFAELMQDVPLLARSTLNLQNSDYTNECGWSKNCYLIFEADDNENCMYSNNMFNCRWSIDCLHVVNCELCFECIDCVDSYNLKYSQDCINCFDSVLMKNCIGCKSCIGCVNMRNKEFYVFNEKKTEAEYRQALAEMVNGSLENIEAMKKKFDAFQMQFPHKCFYGRQNESSRGDHIRNTQRCYECFDTYNAQDCKYVFNARNTKKVHDMVAFGAEKGVEFCYENHSIGDSCRNILFCDQIWSGCADLLYSKVCLQNCRQLFGCIALRHDEYCILNKKYDAEEYHHMAAKLIEHMQRTGEWGQPLPATMSPFCYNESIAQQFYPRTKEEAEKEGYTWKDNILEIQEIKKIIPAEKLPDRIADIPDDVLNWAIRCPNTNRPFRIIEQEYKYYAEHNVPLPRYNPDERHRLRMEKRNPQKIWQRDCQKCNKKMDTSYAPDRPEIVYCESCYLKAVY